MSVFWWPPHRQQKSIWCPTDWLSEYDTHDAPCLWWRNLYLLSSWLEELSYLMIRSGSIRKYWSSINNWQQIWTYIALHCLAGMWFVEWKNNSLRLHILLGWQACDKQIKMLSLMGSVKLRDKWCTHYIFLYTLLYIVLLSHLNYQLKEDPKNCNRWCFLSSRQIPSLQPWLLLPKPDLGSCTLLGDFIVILRIQI